MYMVAGGPAAYSGHMRAGGPVGYIGGPAADSGHMVAGGPAAYSMYLWEWVQLLTVGTWG